MKRNDTEKKEPRVVLLNEIAGMRCVEMEVIFAHQQASGNTDVVTAQPAPLRLPVSVP